MSLHTIGRAGAFLLVFISLVFTPASGRTEITARPVRRASMAFARLPLAFEANQGQTDRQAQFLARLGNHRQLFLAPTQAVFTLPNHPKATTLRMQLCNANPNALPQPLQLLPGKVNYLRGRDPRHWQTNVPTYASVRYREVYPGIDLLYYGRQQRLEYDFVVSARANPRAIRLSFGGARSVRVDGQGDLVVGLSQGEVRWHRPLVYQEGSGKRKAIAGKYVLLGGSGASRQVGFAVGKYDRSRPLVIDPVLVYSTFLGGSDEEYAAAITVDGAGCVYVAGTTRSPDFPTTSGAFQGAKSTPYGVAVAFVTKLNPTGTALLTSTYLGGSDENGATGIAVDGAGCAYVTGYTYAADLPTTAGALQSVFGGDIDAFVAKLNPNGSGLLYSTYLGGTAFDQTNGIAVDAGGDAYVVGETGSSDFPTTAGAFQRTFGGVRDAFVAKLNPNGAALLYSTYLGGSDVEFGMGIALDAAGNACVTGGTFSTNYPVTPGAFQSANGGLTDAFVARLDATKAGAASLLSSTYLGGSDDDAGWSVALDAAGNAYVTGNTVSANFPTTAGAFQTTFGGLSDAFVTKLNPTGSALVYSTYLGGVGDEPSSSIAVDGWGNAYVAGYTNSTDFPVTPNARQAAFGGGYYDAYLTKLNALGSARLYASFLGGSGDEFNWAVALDRTGSAYVTGQTSSADFPTTPGAFQTTNGSSASGGNDAYVAKLRMMTRSDFDGDGKPDLLWQNQATGGVVCWLMDGARQVGTASLLETGNPHWKIVGAADLNGDDRSDLLWQNQATGGVVYWLMDGLTNVGGGWLVETGNPDWKIVGFADFNGDGKPDLLWQNQATGGVVYWLMNGVVRNGGGWLVQSGNPDWKIVGFADFNGDGKPDLLWQNRATGGVVYWLMNGTDRIGGGWLVETGNPDWRIIGTPDLNGDEKPDLLWQSRGSGASVYWLMDGVLRVGGGYILADGNPFWQIVSPR